MNVLSSRILLSTIALCLGTQARGVELPYKSEVSRILTAVRTTKTPSCEGLDKDDQTYYINLHTNENNEATLMQFIDSSEPNKPKNHPLRNDRELDAVLIQEYQKDVALLRAKKVEVRSSADLEFSFVSHYSFTNMEMKSVYFDLYNDNGQWTLRTNGQLGRKDFDKVELRMRCDTILFKFRDIGVESIVIYKGNKKVGQVFSKDLP